MERDRRVEEKAESVIKRKRQRGRKRERGGETKGRLTEV